MAKLKSILAIIKVQNLELKAEAFFCNPSILHNICANYLGNIVSDVWYVHFSYSETDVSILVLISENLVF